MAAIATQPEIVTQILDKDGVDVNIQEEDGNTALMVAVAGNQPDIATQILIETMWMSIFNRISAQQHACNFNHQPEIQRKS